MTFSEALKASGHSPNEYAALSGFDKRNVVKWCKNDASIPLEIRAAIFGAFRIGDERISGLKERVK